MQKKKAITLSVISAVIIVVAVLAILAFSMNGHAVNSNAADISSAQKTLFSNSPYYSYAYQIFPGVLSADAQKAITGFNLDLKNNQDGSVTMTLNATNQEYQTQEYTMKPGEKLYFIERSLGDDSDGDEHFLGDDKAVVVNSEGYIVQGPGSA